MGKSTGEARIMTPHMVGIVVAMMCSAALVGVAMFTFHEETVSSRPAVIPYDFFWCAEDDHCVVVDKIGCCSCEQGGAQVAVNSWHRDDLRRFLKKACRPHDKQVCIQMDLCRDEFIARCVERRCRLVVAGE